MPLVDGDDKEYQGYADHVCIKANTKKRPTLVNPRQNANRRRRWYFVRWLLCQRLDCMFGSWTTATAKKCLPVFNAIQFVKDGEAFGYLQSEGADDFEDLDDEFKL